MRREEENLEQLKIILEESKQGPPQKKKSERSRGLRLRLGRDVQVTFDGLRLGRDVHVTFDTSQSSYYQKKQWQSSNFGGKNGILTQTLPCYGNRLCVPTTAPHCIPTLPIVANPHSYSTQPLGPLPSIPQPHYITVPSRLRFESLRSAPTSHRRPE